MTGIIQYMPFFFLLSNGYVVSFCNLRVLGRLTRLWFVNERRLETFFLCFVSQKATAQSACSDRALPYNVAETDFWFIVEYTKAPFHPPMLYSFSQSLFHDNHSGHHSLPKKNPQPVRKQTEILVLIEIHTLLSALMHILFIGIKARDHVELIIMDRGQGMNVHVQLQDLSLSQGEYKAHPQAIIHLSPAF